MSTTKDPNRPCPDCGTTDKDAFYWQYNKRTARECRDRLCKKCRAKRTLKNGNLKRSQLKFKYNLTEIDIELKLKAQNNLCDLCHLPLIGSGHTDHDHKTGLFRAVLHRDCNIRLATVEDEVFLQQALSYLEKHAKKDGGN
jgi:hypothetical protein